MAEEGCLLSQAFSYVNVKNEVTTKNIFTNKVNYKENFTISNDFNCNNININNINIINNTTLNNILIYDNIITTDNQGLNLLFMHNGTGNIGIGITNPQEKNHITGNLLIDNNINVNGLSTFNNLNISGISTYNNININGTGTLYNVDITNNLIVRGTKIEIDTTNMIVKDNIINLNYALAVTDSNIYRDAGILINRGGDSNIFIGWDEPEEDFIVGVVTSTTLDSEGNENFLLTSDNLRVNILKSNKIGIGTNEPHSNLEVYGNSILNGNINIKGSLDVDSDVTFNNTTQLTDSSSGALIVKGGAGIGKNVNIGGSLNIDSVTSINSTIQSTDSSTGALVISGGVGIAKNVNIGSSLNVQNSTNLLNTLTVDSDVTFNSTIQSTDLSTGALIVNGGTAIAKNINIGGS